MRFTQNKIVLGLQLTFLMIALQACRKASPEPQSSTSTNADEIPPQLQVLVFNPQRKPIEGKAWPSNLEKSYEAAAASASEFQNAMPYARAMVLQNALPKIKDALVIYQSELGRDPKLENPAMLMQADSRFAGIPFEPQYQALLKSQNLSLNFAPSSADNEIIRDEAAKADSPEVGNVPAVGVSHFGPASIPSGLSAVGKSFAADFLSSQEKAAVDGACIRLVKAVETDGANPNTILALHTNDQLYARAAKIGVKALYEDFLGNLVAYKGSLFVGAISKNGELQIWEMKQPFLINASLNDIDEKARLNTGIEVDANFGFTTTGDLCREYENGFWSTWGNTPPLNSFHIVKTAGWSIQRNRANNFRSFVVLTSAQIDAALQRTDTTKIIGRAEGTLLSFKDETLTPSELAILIQSYTAREDFTNAMRCAEEFVKRQPELADLSTVAKSLTELLCRVCPSAGVGFYDANLFDYYAPYKKLGMVPDFEAAGVPKRTDRKHPYNAVPIDLVSYLAATYEKIVAATPDDCDARFDLAMLYSLYASKQGDRLSAAERIEKAADNLRFVFSKTKGISAASRRDFSNIITHTPTFLPFDACNDVQLEKQFESVLKIVGSSQNDFRGRFSKAGDYYQEGY